MSYFKSNKSRAQVFIVAFQTVVKIASSCSDNENTIWEPGSELFLLNKSFLYFNTIISGHAIWSKSENYK